MNVLVLHDAFPLHPTEDEADSIEEVQRISETLEGLGHRVGQRTFVNDMVAMKQLLSSLRFDIVCNMVENAGGRRLFLVPFLCGMLGLRCTGGSADGLLLSSDKVMAKRLLRDFGLPTPDWVDARARDAVDGLLGVPVIVKPIAEEASVGIGDASVRVFATRRQLFDAIGVDRFAERYVEGREFNVSVLPHEGNPEVLPPAEMRFIDYPDDKPKIVGYEAKWKRNSFAYGHTRRTFSFPLSDSVLLASLCDLASACWYLFGARGYIRVDVRIDALGNPFVLEVNLNPCISTDSGFVAACRESGISYRQMVERIVGG